MVDRRQRRISLKSGEEMRDVEGWFVCDRNGLCVGPGGCDRGDTGQGRCAHRRQLFLQPEGSRTDRRSLPYRGRRSGRGPGHVSRDEDCRKIVAAAAPGGRLDALINNAGITKHMPHDNLDGLSAEDFQRLFGVNTIGPFQMVRAARSLLEAGAKAAGRASAGVHVSSVAGISGIGSLIAYAASKGALNTITYSL